MLSRRALIGLLALACVRCGEAVEHPSPVGPPLTDLLGLAGFPSRGGTPPDDHEFHRQASRELGLTWLRDDMLWERVEPRPGEWQWEHYDRIIDGAVANGQRIIGLLTYGNPWATAEPPVPGSAHYPPDDLQDYANFVREVVSRYRDRVKVWEIWNEPNSIRFWAGSLRGDPAAYGALLKVGSEAVRAADPEATVLYGGLFYHDQGLTTAAPAFLAASHAAHPDLALAYDGLALHPYDRYPPRRAPEYQGDESESFETMVGEVRGVLEVNGGGEKGIWITEYGWPVHPGVSEQAQAAYLVRGALILASLGVRSICWYTFWNGEVSDAIIPEGSFGLFHWQDVSPAEQQPRPKPAYEALSRLSQALGGLGFVEDRSKSLDGASAGRALLFSDGRSRSVTVSWESDAEGEPVYTSTSP